MSGHTPGPNAGILTKNQRSILLYAESCLVDRGGLLEGLRMNAEDVEDLEAFADAGLLVFGRIPASLLKSSNAHNSTSTHWVKFSEQAWALAAACRQLRAQQRGPYAASVFAEVESREAAKAQQGGSK